MKAVGAGVLFVGAALCAQAGFWQVRRKRWKENLIKERDSQLELQPVPVKSGLETAREYIPVGATGVFLHEKEMKILKKYSGRNGYFVVTPLVLGNSDGILVNRGWVPLEKKFRGQERRLAEVTGVLRKTATHGKFTPKNSPELNEWFSIDIPMMSQWAGIPALDFYIQAVDFTRNRELYEGEELPELPVRAVRSDLGNWYLMPETHSSYAVFWFGSSGICGIFLFLLFKGKV